MISIEYRYEVVFKKLFGTYCYYMSKLIIKQKNIFQTLKNSNIKLENICESESNIPKPFPLQKERKKCLPTIIYYFKKRYDSNT